MSACSVTRERPRASSGLLAFLLVWCVGSQAWAKAPPEFDQRLAEAQRYYTAKDYDRSITELQAAYALNPMPSLLINIGRCHYLANRPREALEFYNRALNSRLTRTEREEVTASVARATIDLQDQQQREAREAAARQAALQERLAQLAPPPSPAPEPAKPVYKKGWFWGIIGGTAAVGLALGLGLGLGLKKQAPPPVFPASTDNVF